MTAPESPGNFEGAGPLFAAVPSGDPWYRLAIRGATTYAAGKPGTSPEAAAEGAAFPGRGQAGEVAGAVADGEFTRYEGLTGYYDCTPARIQTKREAAGIYAAMPARPVWPADVRMAPEAGQ